ncbi:MGH1-like glycoside hydrolase domain-containing protein [uncultured Demequina sp.]|uniref:MGH1-like glycoside hydrolase domain-containing protein n=1 Tax=uncultured Demequina sp. TaxID=693499 RepID=UPI0025D12CF8|nr:hypothetical protein [uncultured Demequina sp.]
MRPLDQALRRLRSAGRSGSAAGPDHALGAALSQQGVGFAAIGGALEDRWDQAVRELEQCISPFSGPNPVLSEGGVYHGAWIESTGTINAEVLSRFAPQVTEATHRLFADNLREDGLMPYKVTADGPGFSQIQIVTPLARSVWHHYLLTGRDREYLRTLFDAMAAMDAWLARHRDTRGTGGVEAFCTFDTGHDLSPRFWGVAERCLSGDATRYDDTDPLLPLVAPDLTANVACQRSYLALIAAELGEDPQPWLDRAASSVDALWRECFDEDDHLFYDREGDGGMRRVRSDVLLRVLACEVGDDAFFEDALRRHLLDRRGFLAAAGLTSIALDDPRFDRDASRNSWAGPVNALTMIRSPHAFEHHGRHAELGALALPMIEALAHADRFPQCFDPWSGEPGFTDVYSPAILYFLDAIERTSGILPRPDGELWFSGLTPTRLNGDARADAVAYRRTHAGVTYELAADDGEVAVWRDGEAWLRFPRGWRIVVGTDGDVESVVGLAQTAVSGRLTVDGVSTPLELAGNDVVAIHGDSPGTRTSIGVVTPRH